MTEDDALYRFRLRALALATELGNVRAACRAMGIHPSTFYRWRAQVLRFGPEILQPEGAAPAEDGQPDLTVHRAAGGGLLARPAWVRTDEDLRGAAARQVGRDRDLPQRGAPGPSPPRSEHQGQAPGPGGRLRRTAGARAPAGSAPAAPAGLPTRGDGADGLLLHRQALRRQGSGVAVHGDRRRLRVLLGGAASHTPQSVGPMDLRARPASGGRPGSARMGRSRR